MSPVFGKQYVSCENNVINGYFPFFKCIFFVPAGSLVERKTLKDNKQMTKQ